MSAGGRQDTKEERVTDAAIGSPSSDATSLADAGGAAVVGSPEYLHTVFARAAAAADRAVGLWLARSHRQPVDMPPPGGRGEADELRALRAMVRAAATAYVRKLRAEGTTPERMLVLVKSVTSDHGAPGFGAQELTNDIVRWSIEAYFDK